MLELILNNINNIDISLFDSYNYYNISLNENINGWLKFIKENNIINIYLTIQNIDGYILFSKNIDYFDFNKISFLVKEKKGSFFINNFIFNKLLINLNCNIKDFYDFENKINKSLILLVEEDDINNYQKEEKIANLINIDKINKIKNEYNMDDLLIEIYKIIKPLNISVNKLLSNNNFLLELINLLQTKK